MTAANKIRTASADDSIEIAGLIDRVFRRQLVAEFDVVASTAFRMFVTSSALRQRLAGGHLAMLCERSGRIAGYLELCDQQTSRPGFNHLSLFFVDPDYQRHGMGRDLLQTAIERLNAVRSTVTSLSVNSSLFSEPIYQRLGFKPIADNPSLNPVFSIAMELDLGDTSLLQCRYQPPADGCGTGNNQRADDR